MGSDAGEQKDAPQVEVTGDNPEVEVNPPAEGGEDAPNALPEDDTSRGEGVEVEDGDKGE